MSTLGIEGAHPGGINLTKEIFKRENINRHSRILDVGCGAGQTAAYLSYRYGAKVTGIDINPTMVDKAERRVKKNRLPVKIMQGSVENIPLPDHHFDFIISESVLSFVNKPRALEEIFRLLKNGGRFIAIEHTINQRLKKTEETEIKNFYGFPSLSTEKDWLDLLKRAGFAHCRIQEHTSIHSVPNFHFPNVMEPELYEIMEKHIDFLFKYKGRLDYRIYSCTK
ncbi:ubiquinone/menaquinone biosynthesis C-methylase UbiE [Sporosarcina luteola]|nr:ubiquinone/menaquinone biosynthesis C-methylase UbiE [Sporosarcina luteola]